MIIFQLIYWLSSFKNWLTNQSHKYHFALSAKVVYLNSNFKRLSNKLSQSVPQELWPHFALVLFHLIEIWRCLPELKPFGKRIIFVSGVWSVNSWTVFTRPSRVANWSLWDFFHSFRKFFFWISLERFVGIIIEPIQGIQFWCVGRSSSIPCFSVCNVSF